MGFVRADGYDSVVYVASDNHVHEFSLPLGSNIWQTHDTFNPPAGWTFPANATGQPRGYVRSDGTSAVVYLSSGGHIWELSRPVNEIPTSTIWDAGELTTIPGVPVSASDPAPYIRADGQSTIMYRSSDLKIWELALPYRSASWSGNTLSTVGGTPPVADGPIGYVRGDNNSAVVFHDLSNNIWELQLAPAGGNLAWSAKKIGTAP
jgi:hypothetical protein